jgi:hypothetical protein|tara:strand:- start:4035 stop:4439 length:405 start_codon:yes stop_codon:yes gene_type:complete
MNTQLFTDKLAISLSAICVLHCLFMPSFLILSSWFAAFSIDNEFIHYAILTVAIPVSAFALIKGFKNHKKLSYFVYGFFGLFLLAFAVLAAGITGEIGEKSLTLLGSLFVIYAHYKNHQICKELNCDCHNLESS